MTSIACISARPFVIVTVGGTSNCWQPGVGISRDFNPVPLELWLRPDIPLYVPSKAVVVFSGEPAIRAAPGLAPSQCWLRVPCDDCSCGVHATTATSAI